MYKLVSLPFRYYFKNRMLTGKKWATSRTKKYGEPGDHFMAFGQEFEIFAVTRVMLGDVAGRSHIPEGFETKEEFLQCWAEIHPRAKFDLTTPVWYHQFSLVKREQNENP